MPKEKNSMNRKMDGKLFKNNQSTPSIELQQSMLNVFRDSFADCTGPTLSNSIQEVKEHLFNRDFDKAFGRPELLKAYAARWSPSRALAYLDILLNTPALAAHMAKIMKSTVEHSQVMNRASTATLPVSPKNQLEVLHSKTGLKGEAEASAVDSQSVVCMGAGSGAEMIALAGYINHTCASISRDNSSTYQSPVSSNAISVKDASNPSLLIKILDIADWSRVVDELYSKATTAPVLSIYASSRAKASQTQLVDPERMNVQFERQDVLAMEVGPLAAILKKASLVTMMFTLNELYNTSMSKATNLLLTSTYLMQSGSLLLVVDSPGSYSTVTMNKTPVQGAPESEKRYPMQWLLDHTLLESSRIGSSQNTSADTQWEKLVSCDSKWFRLPQGLKYPMEVEDMRYQLHLYRRI
ncbi:hypothetical protein MMC14_001955 [Varicellaria rhodocarpa]|nr:hypothetical protein [Varicellaria rhodocarpa]